MAKKTVTGYGYRKEVEKLAASTPRSIYSQFYAGEEDATEVASVVTWATKTRAKEENYSDDEIVKVRVTVEVI